MRRVLIFLLAIVIFIPLSAVSVSATSFELAAPYKLSYIKNTSRNPQYFLYFNSYRIYDSDEGRVYTGGSSGFERFTYRLVNNGVESDLWSLGSSNVYPSTLISPDGATKSNFLWIRDGNNRSNDLTFASFVYEGIVLPVTGQYLKVTISFFSFLENIPSYYNYLLDPSYLCFLCDDNSGTGDVYSLPRLSASSVSITNKGNNFYEYNFYFNYNGIDPSLFTSDNICLAVRIPFYFADNSRYSNGVTVYAPASLPSAYEIITIGGYDQELNSIKNAIYTSNQQLIDLYTTQSEEDVTYVLKLDNSNSELENSIFDYQSAAAPVQQIRDQFTTPPLGDSVNQVFDDFSPSGVKSVFSLGWVISAVGLVFSFCLVRLILYGTKEG